MLARDFERQGCPVDAFLAMMTFVMETPNTGDNEYTQHITDAKEQWGCT